MDIKPFCNTDIELIDIKDYKKILLLIDPQHHIIAAKEGNATALAAGYHLATGKVPVVQLSHY